MRGRTPISTSRNGKELGQRPSRGPGLTGALRPAGASGEASPGLVYPLVRGPYQNNGATPWYAELALGTPGQTLKVAFDTGSNFIWMTSTLCARGGCRHYGEGKFNPYTSRSFAWVDRSDEMVSFGPWGNMIIETGSDDFGLVDGCAPRASFLLAKAYSGSQFEELDWDGGIGFPASSDTSDPGVSFLMAELLQLGYVDPGFPYISFSLDAAAQTGACRIGAVDPSAFDPESGLFLRWSPYLAFSGVGYLWSTALQRYAVGDTLVASNVLFCLDSGSSQFKGDDRIMKETLALVSGPNPPDVRLSLGATGAGEVGEIVVPPSVYMVEIQAGPDKGKTLPQFNPLGLTDLVLVGSVLMDHLYTVFEYDVTQVGAGYELAPVGMWIFNKAGGPKLIRSRQRTPALARKPVHER